MTHDIKICPLAGNWSIKAAGDIIDKTRAALELVKRDYAPRIYFSCKDIAMAFLDYTEKQLIACTNVIHAISQIS